jgi:hypothetical protein
VLGDSPPVSQNGTLTVAVTDVEGRPLSEAWVWVFNETQTWRIGGAQTNATGVATIESIPPVVRVSVGHPSGEPYSNPAVAVSQQGTTYYAVTLAAARPHPTVALLPVSIPAGSINVDRSELTLQITVVASASAPFQPAGYGDYSTNSTPSLGLSVGASDGYGDCYVWLDNKRTTPSCGDWGPGAYALAVQEFDYAPNGGPAPLGAPIGSAMLLLDQSQRVAPLDGHSRRSFAARAFVHRSFSSSALRPLSITGLARTGGDPVLSTALLQGQPMWSPLGSGSPYSTDRTLLNAGIGMLEPLIGGSAPIFDAFAAALTLAAAEAPAGTKAIVALLGGGDEDNRSEAEHQAALAALRRQRDETAIQVVLIAGAPRSQPRDRAALAELAAALRAPTISLGVEQTWASGSYGALDLAADLLDGLALPTLSAEFRVSGGAPNAFPAGATLAGVVYLESSTCPMGCWEFPIEFVVEIP